MQKESKSNINKETTLSNLNETLNKFLNNTNAPKPVTYCNHDNNVEHKNGGKNDKCKEHEDNGKDNLGHDSVLHNGVRALAAEQTLRHLRSENDELKHHLVVTAHRERDLQRTINELQAALQEMGKTMASQTVTMRTLSEEMQRCDPYHLIKQRRCMQSLLKQHNKQNELYEEQYKQQEEQPELESARQTKLRSVSKKDSEKRCQESEQCVRAENKRLSELQTNVTNNKASPCSEQREQRNAQKQYDHLHHHHRRLQSLLQHARTMENNLVESAENNYNECHVLLQNNNASNQLINYPRAKTRKVTAFASLSELEMQKRRKQKQEQLECKEMEHDNKRQTITNQTAFTNNREIAIGELKEMVSLLTLYVNIATKCRNTTSTLTSAEGKNRYTKGKCDARKEMYMIELEPLLCSSVTVANSSVNENTLFYITIHDMFNDVLLKTQQSTLHEVTKTLTFNIHNGKKNICTLLALSCSLSVLTINLWQVTPHNNFTVSRNGVDDSFIADKNEEQNVCVASGQIPFSMLLSTTELIHHSHHELNNNNNNSNSNNNSGNKMHKCKVKNSIVDNWHHSVACSVHTIQLYQLHTESNELLEPLSLSAMCNVSFRVNVYIILPEQFAMIDFAETKQKGQGKETEELNNSNIIYSSSSSSESSSSSSSALSSSSTPMSSQLSTTSPFIGADLHLECHRKESIVAKPVIVKTHNSNNKHSTKLRTSNNLSNMTKDSMEIEQDSKSIYNKLRSHSVEHVKAKKQKHSQMTKVEPEISKHKTNIANQHETNLVATSDVTPIELSSSSEESSKCHTKEQFSIMNLEDDKCKLSKNATTATKDVSIEGNNKEHANEEERVSAENILLEKEEQEEQEQEKKKMFSLQQDAKLHSSSLQKHEQEQEEQESEEEEQKEEKEYQEEDRAKAVNQAISLTIFVKGAYDLVENASELVDVLGKCHPRILVWVDEQLIYTVPASDIVNNHNVHHERDNYNNSNENNSSNNNIDEFDSEEDANVKEVNINKENDTIKNNISNNRSDGNAIKEDNIDITWRENVANFITAVRTDSVIYFEVQDVSSTGVDPMGTASVDVQTILLNKQKLMTLPVMLNGKHFGNLLVEFRL